MDRAAPPQPKTAFLGLGSNLGDRHAHLRAALDALDAWPGCHLERASDVVETPAMYVTDQPAFLNLCAQITTTLSPEALLDAALEIERRLGRVRTIDKGPRTIDLDLLFYDDLILHTPRLDLPHPLLHERTFVLIPMSQLAPALLHPERGESIVAMLQNTQTPTPGLTATPCPFKKG